MTRYRHSAVRNGRARLGPFTTGVMASCSIPRSRRSAQRGKDLPGDDLDLLGLVAVGDQDDAIDARGHVGAELLDALPGAAADRVLDGRLAPGGHVPLRLQPLAHRRLRLGPRGPDQDRQLIGAGERLRISPGLAREADDLLPGLGVAL